jgi:glycolate oxidase FAD binding subunit
MDLVPSLQAFAAEIGSTGPVAVAGGRTDWAVGGALTHETRVVTAPVGVIEHEASEMTVRVGAGTSVEELDAALAPAGQRVALPSAPGATVGGVLAVGRSGSRRLGWGPIRDTVLQIRYVSAEGTLVTAGGPMIKNVSGFDLCRLLVGSLGTLGFLGEVILRTRPVPEAERWMTGAIDPDVALDRLPSAVTVFWDGRTTWVRLSGLDVDVQAQEARGEALGLAPCDDGPARPGDGRWSLPPAALAALPQRHPELRFVAEMGVGVVHADAPPPQRPVAPRVAALHQRLKSEFDPDGRLNPGRDPLAS